MIMKKSILASAALCCLILTTPISADRAGASIDFDDSEDQAVLTPLLNLEKKKKLKFTHDNQINKKYVLDGSVSAEGKFLIKPKNKSRGSLFVRSFLLAALFWAVKFVLPQIIRYWGEHRQVVSSSGRGRKRGKSRRHNYDEEDLSTVVTTDQTISPSVMELLDMGNDFGDDGASFITAGTMGTTGTFATYLSSLVSKYRSRRKEDMNPLARFNPPSGSRKSKSSSAVAAKSNQSHHDQHHQSTKHRHKSKQLDLSKISQRHSFKGLQFIDEDNNSDDIIKGSHSSSRQQDKGSKEHHHNKGSDPPQLPSVGGILKKDHRYNSHHKNNDPPSSPLERKLSVGASQKSDHNHKRGKDKDYHRNQHHHQHNEGHHHHRDRWK